MKERGILFSAPMVRVILSGAKTQTRRVVAEPKQARLYGRASLPARHFVDQGLGDGIYVHWFYGGGDLGDDAMSTRVHCPHGTVGDHLWVRETWDAPPGSDERAEVAYRADYERDPEGATWRPSIFMPRWASRITLEITDVRVERLQSISEEDAKAEGVPPMLGKPDPVDPAYRDGYRQLWESINSKRTGCAWADNPWVWAITFTRVQP